MFVWSQNESKVFYINLYVYNWPTCKYSNAEAIIRENDGNQWFLCSRLFPEDPSPDTVKVARGDDKRKPPDAELELGAGSSTVVAKNNMTEPSPEKFPESEPPQAKLAPSPEMLPESEPQAKSVIDEVLDAIRPSGSGAPRRIRKRAPPEPEPEAKADSVWQQFVVPETTALVRPGAKSPKKPKVAPGPPASGKATLQQMFARNSLGKLAGSSLAFVPPPPKEVV